MVVSDCCINEADADIYADLAYSQIVPHTNTFSRLLPIILLFVGVLLGIASGLLALLPGTNVAPIVCGAGAAVAAIILTFTIAVRQNADTDSLRLILRQVEEQTAKEDYDPVRDQEEFTNESDQDGELAGAARALTEGSDRVNDPVEAANAESAPAGAKPAYADEVVEALRELNAKLNFDDLRWRRKIPSPPMRGHHGWFVESNSNGNYERWFVRRANGLTVRKAMPRDFLEALEREGVDPRVIKHDFQLTNHGLASWYARTYSGALWKVARGNRNLSGGISVTLENADK
ncbi:hypothetical protein [Arthrobacter sp. GMC3]|uniref:hypothetical protein n=1 Tax=Arthrobacter sp. GMC3 TaxID=2058894 RepID=UPI000CE3032F|nr:hypothetical protein [Arthrobacter sp. GMC3]